MANQSREGNVDNRKFGPATTKAEASQAAVWPYSMGEWDAPGQTLVTDNDDRSTEDDVQQNNVPGPVQYNPVSKPIGRQP